MKVVFLDIDGVLNNAADAHATGGYPFPAEGIGKGSIEENPRHSEKKLSTRAVELVRDLCQETGAVIVLHSTWRLHVDRKRFAIDWGLPIIDITPTESHGFHAMSKNRSIVLWLEAHKDVEKFVVLDDDNMAWPGPMNMPQQVFTDPYVGLTPLDVAKARKILA